MASFNKVILMGNLTRDPELRYTPKGTAVAKLGLAVNRTWRNAEGQQQDETTFVDVDAFLISLNERLLIGHFEIWSDQSWPLLKLSFPMPTNQSLCRNQLEQASLLVLKECEKFYPAFQIFAWDNQDVSTTLQHLMLETQGEV